MTMNNSGGGTWFNVRQFHKSTGTITAETVPAGTTNISCGASGTKCSAPTVTIGAGNDVVASLISVINAGVQLLHHLQILLKILTEIKWQII